MKATRDGSAWRDKNECGSWNTEGVWVGVARREGTGWAVGTVNKRGNRCVFGVGAFERVSLELTVGRGGVTATGNDKGGGHWHNPVCVFKTSLWLLLLRMDLKEGKGDRGMGQGEWWLPSPQWEVMVALTG